MAGTRDPGFALSARSGMTGLNVAFPVMPALIATSTSSRHGGDKDVDGRDKPGHDA
jgi:hypothetical protein